MSIWNFICRLFSFKGERVLLSEDLDSNTKDTSQASAEAVVEKQRENEPRSEESQSENLASLADALLDNKEYIRLMEECAALIAEFEQYYPRMQTDEGKMMVELIGQRLREAMLLSGAQSIDDDHAFNILRHAPIPMRYVTDGTSLEEIIEMGIAVGERVFVKAKVKVKG